MRLAHLCAMLMLLFVMPLLRGAALADDVSDVRTAAERFAREMYEGDAQAAKKDAELGEEGGRWLDAIGATAKAANRLRRVGEAHFGREGGKIFSVRSLGLELEGAEIQVTGDTAIVRPKGQGPAHFVRIDGAWKADLRKIVPAYTASFNRLASMLDHTADEVEANRYATAADARTALARSLAPPAASPKPAQPLAQTQPTRRRVDQQPDGTLMLWARDATDIGHCRIDNVSDVQCVTGWADEHDVLRWREQSKRTACPESTK